MRTLGSAQLISDRCLEMQRSKHGSHSALELQTEPLGLSCSLRWCWERGQEWSGPRGAGDKGRLPAGRNGGRAEPRFPLKAVSLGRGVLLAGSASGPKP